MTRISAGVAGVALIAAAWTGSGVQARMLKQTTSTYETQNACVSQARLVSKQFIKMIQKRERFAGGERYMHDQRPGKFIVQTFYEERGRSLIATIVCKPGGASITTHQTIE